MNADRKPPALSYESRQLPERPLKIYPDPDSNKPFLIGMIVGTFAPAVSFAFMLAVSGLLKYTPVLKEAIHAKYSDASAGLSLILLGTPALDLILRISTVIVLRKRPHRSSLISGLVVSVVVGYIALLLMIACVLSLFGT